MVILGIDPGTKVTGYGIIKKNKHGISIIKHGEIKIAKGESISACLHKIYGSIIDIITSFIPNAIVVENIFLGKNVQSLIKQGQARGVIILAASHCNIPIFEYSPLEIKKAVVGYGRADKYQVQRMVSSILDLSSLPPEDASDALAIAICHLNFLKAEPI